MPRLRWTNEGVRFTDRARNFVATAGEYDIDDEDRAEEYLAHPSDGWERVDDAEDEGGTGDDLDPSEYTLDELEAGLEDADADADTLHDRESEGDDRVGAHEIIDAVLGE